MYSTSNTEDLSQHCIGKVGQTLPFYLYVHKVMEYKAGLLFFRLVGMSKQARNPEFGKSKEEGAQDTQKQNMANLLGVLQMFWTTIPSYH